MSGAAARPVVEPSQIERELVKIWREAAAADAAEESSAHSSGEIAPRLRATLCNLILVGGAVTDSSVQRYVDSVITELCVAHPSRFFVVDLESELPAVGGGGPEAVSETSKLVQTGVSSRCVLANSGAHLCSEEVYVRATPAGVVVVPNLLTSLLVADVEVVLALVVDPLLVNNLDSSAPMDRLLVGLRPLVDKLVYDSSTFVDYRQSLECLLRFGRVGATSVTADGTLQFDGAHQVTVRDLNWQRTKRWRTLIAEQFSGQRFERGEEAVAGVRLEACCDGDALGRGIVPADVLLLAGWFVASLRYKLTGVRTGSGSLILQCQNTAGAERQIEIAASGGGVAPIGDGATLLGVRIETLDVSERGVISLRQVAGEAAVEIVTEGMGEQPDGSSTFVRRSPFLPELRERLLHTCIISGFSDRRFAASLGASLQIAGMFGK